MKEILGRYLEPLGTSKNINDGSSLGAHGPGGSPLYAVSNVQYDMSSDSEIELLRDPAHEDLVGTGQLLDETDSEGEIGEELTQDVSSNQNEAEVPSNLGDDCGAETPGECSEAIMAKELIKQ